VALLTGISKHVGFPAAPDVLGASEEERAEDLEAIGVSSYFPVFFLSLGVLLGARGMRSHG
jgi:hypothetical protein